MGSNTCNVEDGQENKNKMNQDIAQQFQAPVLDAFFDVRLELDVPSSFFLRLRLLPPLGRYPLSSSRLRLVLGLLVGPVSTDAVSSSCSSSLRAWVFFDERAGRVLDFSDAFSLSWKKIWGWFRRSQL